jgi:hypothetical protein
MESYTYFLLHKWLLLSVAYTLIHQEVKEKQQTAIKHACARPTRTRFDSETNLGKQTPSLDDNFC